MILTTICIIVIMAVAALIFAITATYFINKVYVPMKYKTMNLTTEEMFSELALIIQNEINLYEKSVFENGGKFLDNRA